MSDNRKPVLADHKRRNKVLTPPLLAAMGDLHMPYSWSKEIAPQLLWIAILQDVMGLADGVNFAIELALAADKNCSHCPKPQFAKITSFDVLGVDEKAATLTTISSTPLYAKANAALACLFELLPDSPMSFLQSDAASDSGNATQAKIYELLPKLYDRHSRESVLCIATGAMISLQQGKLRFAGPQGEELATKLSDDFSVIEQYPDTDASRAAGASFRALAPMFLFSGLDGPDQRTIDWLDQFWRQVGAFGECNTPIELGVAQEEPPDEPERIIARFRNSARTELYARLNALEFDLKEIEQHEVVGALLARQVTLAIDLAASPAVWTPHSAPLFLRAMADVYIVLAWIFGSRQERAKKFIEDGLGNIKLEIAHRKAELEKNGDPDGQLAEIIEYWDSWLASQKMAELVEVNLGNWSGLTTRAMAQEAGCLDFYNYVYQPFSNAVHSSWPHVSDKNALYCLNPAHRWHRIAISEDLHPDPHWLVLGAKYLEKAFKLYDEKTGITIGCQSAYEGLLEALEGSQPQEPEEDA